VKIPIFVYFLCLISALVGGAILVYHARNVLTGILARSWPQTVGTITKADRGETRMVRSRNPELHVVYRYEVDGHAFEGTGIHAAYTSRAHPDDADLRDQYLDSVDKKVTVYYHPKHPARSFLSVGFYSGSLPILFVGALFFLFGLIFALFAWFTENGNYDFLKGIIFHS